MSSVFSAFPRSITKDITRELLDFIIILKRTIPIIATMASRSRNDADNNERMRRRMEAYDEASSGSEEASSAEEEAESGDSEENGDEKDYGGEHTRH